ncbi:MAG: hypothetical protein HQ515_00195, partial [Phycisphaeraceae bacterium]|nr:hypothetical protein [Phycisphaeraceae bacterium]
RHAEGLDLALEVLECLKDRTFRVKGRTIRAKAVEEDEAIRFLKEELPEYYQYETRVVSYVTRRNACQVKIYIEGWLGIRRDLRRYSPLDIKLLIATE